jgi:hypothetical protein
MMLTMLRTAFLAYVRVLLCLQGLYLGFWVWALWPSRVSSAQFWPLLGLDLIIASLALAQIVAALLLRRGRHRAMITAIVLEVLWAVVAGLIWFATLMSWPRIDMQLLGLATVVTALSLVAVAGLLLRPVLDYAGLARR